MTSLDGGTTGVYALYDPSLANSGKHDAGRTRGSTLLAARHHGTARSPARCAAEPAFTRHLQRLRRRQRRLDRPARATTGWTGTTTPPPAGNLVQIGRLAADRHGVTRARSRSASAHDRASAAATAGRSLDGGFATRRRRPTPTGWHGYLDGLDRAPRSVARRRDLRTQYNVAAMTLKAHEDKTYRGANIASLTHPVGRGDQRRRGRRGRLPPRLGARPVPGRDRAARRRRPRRGEPRRWTTCSTCSRSPTARSRRTRCSTARPTGAACSSTRSPSRSCWPGSSGARDAGTWAHVKKAADFLVARGPPTPQERWEEDGRLLAEHDRRRDRRPGRAADIARANGDDASRHALHRASPTTGSATSRTGRSPPPARSATATTTSASTTTANPDDGTSSTINNGGGTYPRERHRRRRLPRAGPPRRASRPTTRTSPARCPSSTPRSRSTPRAAPMWYRYNHDGYGEKADGSPYDGTGDRPPVAAALAASAASTSSPTGRPAARRTCAPWQRAATPAYMIPEQVWDRPADRRAHASARAPARRPRWPGRWRSTCASPAHRRRHARRAARVVADRYAGGDLPAGPALTLTSPEPACGRRRPDVERRGHAPTATTAYRRVERRTRRLTLGPDGSFSTRCRCALGGNQVTVVARGADGGTAPRPAHGHLDHLGDGGRRRRPTRPATTTARAATSTRRTAPSAPARFDLTELGVYDDGGSVEPRRRPSTATSTTPGAATRSRCSASTSTCGRRRFAAPARRRPGPARTPTSRRAYQRVSPPTASPASAVRDAHGRRRRERRR